MLRVIHPTPDSVMTYGAKDAGNLFLMIVAVFCNASVRHADFGVDLGLWVAEGLVTEVHKCTRTDHAQVFQSHSLLSYCSSSVGSYHVHSKRALRAGFGKHVEYSSGAHPASCPR